MRWLLVALGLLACVPADGPMMRPGSDCLACHSAGGSATPWTVAGTVYAAGAAVAGANVRITDSAGSTFGLRTNRAGNFYTAESVAFPLRVCVERGGAADCMESVVSQGSCNTCHGPEGAAAPANHPFPIEVTSKHAAIGCTQCHADMADPTNDATFQCASCHTARTPLLATNHTTHTSNPSLVVSEYSEGSDACLRCHADAQGDVVLDGPIPDDSASYAAGRVERGLQDFAAVGLPAPGIFEFPHYAGSAVDARTIATRFATAYHRGLYFGGALAQGPDDLSHVAGQFFPYAVHDVYGWKVLPENLGNYEPLPQNNHPPRLPVDLLRNANAARVVRDGFASFYFHPYYPLSVLKQIVGDVQAAGYTFVGPDAP